MIDDQKDLGSDASRTDTEKADRTRETLKKEAEKGIERAISENPSAGNDNQPGQNPADGSHETVERDLTRKDEAGVVNDESVADEPATKKSPPGSEAAEPSPEK
jgi:hypothetical protein